jgi:hypothetical protein
MVWSEQEITAFKARTRAAMYYEGNDSSKVDDFVCQDQGVQISRRPRRISKEKKWTPTPTAENARSDDWLGIPSTKKQSWKVKSTRAVIPDPP